MDLARAIFRVAKNNAAGAFIFEIARSEIGYTSQPPIEYSACVLAAAIAEGYSGAVFIQGDHFQVNAKKFAQDPDKEIGIILSCFVLKCVSMSVIKPAFINCPDSISLILVFSWGVKITSIGCPMRSLS